MVNIMNREREREPTEAGQLMGPIFLNIFKETEIALSNKSVKRTILKIKANYRNNHIVAS